MDTSIPFCESTIRLIKRESKYIVSKDAPSLGMWRLCGLPSAHVLHFIFPHMFYFIRFICFQYYLFCDFIILSGSRSPINSIFYRWVYYFYTPAIYLFAVPIYPFLGCHLRKCRIHSYIVHIMHELLFFFFSVDELGAIFLFTKLHLRDISTFPCIFHYRSCASIITLLDFYIACFCCVFISVYWYILVTCVNLVLCFLG